MEHSIKAERAPSRSKVGERVTWTCSCGEVVGRTWRDSDGLHAESTWATSYEGTPGDWSTYSYARDFSQTVARAREHLTKRHMLDLDQRNDEIAIAAESQAQGQTLPPAHQVAGAAASETVNSGEPWTTDFDSDVAAAWSKEATRTAVADLAQRTGAIQIGDGYYRASPLQLARHLQLIINAAEELQHHAVKDAVNGARGTGSHASWADVADALGVSRQAAWKKYRSA